MEVRDNWLLRCIGILTTPCRFEIISSKLQNVDNLRAIHFFINSLYHLIIQFQEHLEFNVKIDMIFAIKKLKYAIFNICKMEKPVISNSIHNSTGLAVFLSAYMQCSYCFLVKCTVKIKDENILNWCLSIAYVYV